MRRPDLRRRRAGDGFVHCDCGQRHWGLLGAAGVLLTHDGHVLLQRRARWAHEGGTWSIPGGALDTGESPLEGALREAAEEAGIGPEDVSPKAGLEVDHGSWAYTTIVARTHARDSRVPQDPESTEMRWVPLDDVGGHDLHPAFAEAWPSLHTLAGLSASMTVDVANVMGSRPDGWWSDRPGAARRLVDEVADLMRTGVRGDRPEIVDRHAAQIRSTLLTWPGTAAVLEGRARAGLPPGSYRGVRIVHAESSGDDHMVDLARQRPGGPVHQHVGVTSDRVLAHRLREHGLHIRGAGWLLDQIAEAFSRRP